jgi:plastocyanin
MKRVFDNKRCRGTETYGARAVAVALAVIAAIGVSSVWAADAVVVSQRDRKFTPDRLTLERGSTARIVNDDRVTHHVYIDAPGMSFDSGEQPIGTTVDLRFDRVGSYDVLCAIHPTMHLRVTVK